MLEEYMNLLSRYVGAVIATNENIGRLTLQQNIKFHYLRS